MLYSKKASPKDELLARASRAQHYAFIGQERGRGEGLAGRAVGRAAQKPKKGGGWRRGPAAGAGGGLGARGSEETERPGSNIGRN
jgi:hypothetical protein